MTEPGPLPAQRVFDFHVRLAPRPGSAQRLIGVLGECGIERAAVCAGGILDPETLARQLVDGGHVETDPDNDAVLAACADSAGRLVPCYFANPHRPAEQYAKRVEEFRGLEISPAVHGVRLDDPRTAALARIAGEAGQPVYVVCLIRPGCGVAELADLARAQPETVFVLGHGGTGNIDFHAVTLIEQVPNILFETSGGYTSVLEVALRRLGPRRLLFGSEFPGQHPSVELAKYRAIGISAEDWALIGWQNAARLLEKEAGA